MAKLKLSPKVPGSKLAFSMTRQTTNFESESLRAGDKHLLQQQAGDGSTRLSQEVNEIRRQQGGHVSPEQVRETAFRALDRLFGQASGLDGKPASAADSANFRATFDDSGRFTGMARQNNTVREHFRDAETRALVPMLGRDVNFDRYSKGPLDDSPVRPINGSFFRFSQSDLDRLSRGESVQMETTRGRLPEGGSREGRNFQIRPGQLRNNVDKVVALIGKNEGSATSINWNDAGSGISVGIQQCNQKTGNLPELLRKMHDQNPEKFEQYFGRYSDSLMSERFVRRAHFSPRNELGRAMQAAIKDPEFQRTQVTLVREHVVRAAEIAQGLGIKSTMGVALVADLTNQFGEGGAVKYLRQAHNRRGEEAKISAIARASEGGHSARRQRFQTIASSGIVSSRDNFQA